MMGHAFRRYGFKITVKWKSIGEKKMYFSSDKAKKELHYRPRDVKSAIKDSVNWMKKYFM